MSRYYGEVINLSLRDISMLKKFKIVDIKKRFLGLVKIYTVELPSKKIEEIAKDFQSNMSTSLKKEWYITFHNRERVIVIFRTRIFDLSGKGITPIHGKMLDISHAELISYAKKLGVPNSQCDFLPEDFSKRTY